MSQAESVAPGDRVVVGGLGSQSCLLEGPALSCM